MKGTNDLRRDAIRRRRRFLFIICGVTLTVIFLAITLLVRTDAQAEVLIESPRTGVVEGETYYIKYSVAPTTEAPTESEEDHRLKILLAQLVQAEAGTQPLTGMRFVVDVVLNRVDDSRFPNTIEEVIFQPGQFAVIRDGNFKRAEGHISANAMRAVELEWNERLDYGILYFSSGSKAANGVRTFKYYDHWFGYED